VPRRPRPGFNQLPYLQAHDVCWKITVTTGL
jgi:hypothetical protein